MTVYIVRKGTTCLNFDDDGVPVWSETTAWVFSHAEAEQHAKTFDAEVVAVQHEPIAYPTMPRMQRSPTVDAFKGEWRCRCPSDPTFDTSINPRCFKACAKCGAERPNKDSNERTSR